MKVVQSLRLVHPMRPMLTKAQLAFFATPRTWVEILASDPTLTAVEWRDGVIDCDEFGWALLRHVPGERKTYGKRAVPESLRRKGQWVLSDKGRTYVGKVAA